MADIEEDLSAMEQMLTDNGWRKVDVDGRIGWIPTIEYQAVIAKRGFTLPQAAIVHEMLEQYILAAS